MLIKEQAKKSHFPIPVFQFMESIQLPRIIFSKCTPVVISQQVIKHFIIFNLFIAVFPQPPSAIADVQIPKMWGVSIAIRTIHIPHKAKMDTAYDLVPLMFYEKHRFFIQGLSAGYRFYTTPSLQISAVTQYRFCDIPSKYQNSIMEETLNFGPRLTYRITSKFNTCFELMSENRGRFHINAIVSNNLFSKNYESKLFVKLRWKNDKFNNTYYGLETAYPGSAFDITIGSDIRFRVYSNFYIFGLSTITLLDPATYMTEIINNSYQSSLLFGIGIFNDSRKPTKTILKSRHYFRVAHGRATPTDLLDILAGKIESDAYNNRLTTLFIGIPVADELFNFPFSIYFTPGIAYHHKSDVQISFPEYVAAVKIFYTFNLPVLLRIGFAEGLSYAAEISYLEKSSLDVAGYKPSKLLNYLDISMDINLSKINRIDFLQKLWLGYSIHHRSGIYKSSSVFGRVKGGSNYNTLYLQYHF